MKKQNLHILKFLPRVFILILITLLTAMVDGAAASPGIINYDVVNIRSGPGTNYQIAGTILKHSQVTILKTQGDWKQVSFGNTTGWIAGQYIDAVGIGDLVITGDFVNLRSGPGTGYTSMGKAIKGESCTLLSQDGDWYHVLTASGQEAYIAGYLAQVAASAPTTTDNSPETSSSGTATSSLNQSINVIINGTAMNFEVPPIIEKGRTLVPLRATFEAMGATVEWNENTRTVIARKGSDLVVLPLNSTKPAVNGQLYTLEVPAKIVQNRTLAPLRFVAEAFGGQVDWNETTKTVEITSASTGITGSAGNHSSGSTDDQSTADPVTAEADNRVHVTKTTDSTGIKIILRSSQSFKPDIKQTSGIIQYDLGPTPLGSFTAVDQALGDGRLSVKAATMADRDVVTIKMPAWVSYQLSSDGNQQYVITIPNYITSIEKTPFGSIGERLTVHSLSPVAEPTGTLNGNQLIVKIPGISLKDGYSFSAGGALFRSVNLNKEDRDVVLTIDTNNLGKYSLAAGASQQDLNIVLMRKMESVTGEKIVVLDPGHGGTAPGSCGSFLKEKDVNLAVALKAGDLLEQRGIKVEYTRIDDTTMALSEEAGIGNEVNAAVFVAIHCNSCDIPGPSGTETYFYAPVDTPELYVQREERLRLANLIQAQMVTSLQRPDRGVKDNKELYVLNHTHMPSALVELGFINNPEEEKLLGDDHFRGLAAQAIADAIQEYLQGS